MLELEKLRIRYALSTDRPAILRVNQAAWEAAYADIFTPEEMQSLFNNSVKQQGSWVMQRDERIATLVAELDAEIIGFIGIGSLVNDKAGEITTFYLLPEYQGLGIGKLLWQAALDLLREEKFPALWVWVLEKAAARQFYEARGCLAKSTGSYSIGQHSEKAIGYWLALD